MVEGGRSSSQWETEKEQGEFYALQFVRASVIAWLLFLNVNLSMQVKDDANISRFYMGIIESICDFSLVLRRNSVTGDVVVTYNNL